MPGFIGKSIRPADNLDLFDTLAPMWQDSALTPNERALVYAIAVLNRHVMQLENTLKKAGLKLEEEDFVNDVKFYDAQNNTG